MDQHRIFQSADHIPFPMPFTKCDWPVKFACGEGKKAIEAVVSISQEVVHST